MSRRTTGFGSSVELGGAASGWLRLAVGSFVDLPAAHHVVEPLRVDLEDARRLARVPQGVEVGAALDRAALVVGDVDEREERDLVVDIDAGGIFAIAALLRARVGTPR